MSLILGTERPEAEALAQMRKFRCGECGPCKSGGDFPCLAKWHAYQNHDLGSREIGHLKFLAVGPGCTFKEAPKGRLPDTKTDINWRYWHVGVVDLATGEILARPPCGGREEPCPT